MSELNLQHKIMYLYQFEFLKLDFHLILKDKRNKMFIMNLISYLYLNHINVKT